MVPASLRAGHISLNASGMASWYSYPPDHRCIHTNPQAGLQSAARLFRTEYEIQNNIGTLNNLNDREALCAVCQVGCWHAPCALVAGNIQGPSCTPR